MSERREVVLTRSISQSGPWGTRGRLDTGSAQYDILERPGPSDVADHPRIPPTDRGYDVDWTIGEHPKHPECYEVKGVAGRTAILIHAANWFEQLLGCLAPGVWLEHLEGDYEGQHIAHAGVTQSRATLEKLIADLGKQPFRLIIKEAA